jgi:hypothetical protein
MTSSCWIGAQIEAKSLRESLQREVHRKDCDGQAIVRHGPIGNVLENRIPVDW